MRIRTHANPFQVPQPLAFDPVATWGRPGPLALEIGSGRGDFLLGLARARPELGCLGLEIRPALVAHIAERARLAGLANVATRLADATRHLPLLLPEAQLAVVYVLFPDPWRKARHRKRRVLQSALLDALASRTAPGAVLYLQTDQIELAQAADREVGAHGAFVNQAGAGTLVDPRLPDCESRRCRMHRARGATIYKLAFARAGDPTPPPPHETWLGFAPLDPREPLPPA